MIANLIATIVAIAWLVLFGSILGLIGSIFLGKTVYDSKPFWLCAILNPEKTSRAVQGYTGLLGTYVMGIIGSIAVLYIIYSGKSWQWILGCIIMLVIDHYLF